MVDQGAEEVAEGKSEDELNQVPNAVRGTVSFVEGKRDLTPPKGAQPLHQVA